jgi:hypothetical protein
MDTPARDAAPGSTSGTDVPLTRGVGNPQDPAVDLGEVWNLLDALPGPPVATDTLTATTLEMAAVTAGPASTTRWSTQTRRIAGRIAPAAVIAGALVAGLAAGRLTAPDIDPRMLSQFPSVRHLDLLREAGSVRFLEELAGRELPSPQRMMSWPGAEAAERETDAFREELASLAGLLGIEAEQRSAAFAASIEALGLEERVELEKSLREYLKLTGTERRALELLAETLADPDRDALRNAAVTWHRWLQAARPEDRERVIAGGTEKRLEWVDWYAARMEARMRPGSFDRMPGDRTPGFGGPRSGPRFEPPPMRPDGGPVAPRFSPREPTPAETPPAPR